MNDGHLYEYLATIADETRVYDGDTVRFDIDLGFEVWIKNTSVRLIGIDAPEIRGAEKEAGKRTRDWLRARLMAAPTILLRTFKADRGKYGRWLADVYVVDGDDIQSVNREMVDLGLARRAVY